MKATTGVRPLMSKYVSLSSFGAIAGIACLTVLAAGASSALAFPGMAKDADAPATAAPIGKAPIGAPPAAAKPSAEAEARLKAALTETTSAKVRVLSPAGKPAVGTAVSLVIAVEGVPVTRLRATTDASGDAAFAAVPTGDKATLIATAAYGGVNYSAPVAPARGQPGAGTLQLAETTSDAKALRIARTHIIVDPSQQGVRITEVVVLHNPGKETYQGKPVDLPLFQGAHNLEADSVLAPSLRLENGILRFSGYLRPGDTQVQFDYSMPLTGSFQRKTSLPLEKLFVVLTKPRFSLTGPSVKRVQQMTRNNTAFLLAEGDAVPAGGGVAFEISPPKDTMGAAPGQGGGQAAGPTQEGEASGGGGGGAEKGPKGELVRDWRTVIKWLSPLVLLFIFFVVVYMAGRKDDPLENADLAALVTEQGRLLAELAPVAKRAAKGERAALRREADLTHRLADVYRAIDEQEARRVLASALPGPRRSTTPAA